MPDQTESAAESRSQAFVAVEGAKGEDIAGGPLLLGAYGTIFVLLLLYVVRLSRLNDATQSEIDRLSKLLSRRDGSQ